MPLSQAFMQSIENGDWLAWSAAIALVCEVIVFGAIGVQAVRRANRKERM